MDNKDSVMSIENIMEISHQNIYFQKNEGRFSFFIDLSYLIVS